VAEQLLDSAYVAVVFEQVRREGMAQSVTGCALRDAGLPDGVLDGSLDDRFVQVMATTLASLASPRQLDPACALPEIPVVLLLDGFQVPAQLGADDGWKRRDPILVAFAGANDDLMPPEINVLHAEAGAFEKAQAGAIHEDGHEARSAAELADDSPYLVAREYDWQSHWPFRAHDVIEPRQILSEHLAIEEQQRAQRLVLRRRSDVTVDGRRA